jgi:hypothetical protein
MKFTVLLCGELFDGVSDSLVGPILCAPGAQGLSLAREYISYGFTTLRDLGSADPSGPPLTFANAIIPE